MIGRACATRAWAAACCAVALSLVLTTAGPLGAVPVSDTAATPAVRIEDQLGAAGRVPMVQLDGWPMGAVTVEVCGFEARRSSADCDPEGAQTAPVPLSGSAAVRLPPLTPPVDCPCVLRASTRDHLTVVRVPVAVPGRRVVPADELPPDPAQQPRAQDLEVTVRIEQPATWVESALSSLGLPSDRTLAVTVRNRGASTMPTLQAAASFGPASGPGTPLSVPMIGDLPPAQERTYRLPVEVPSAGFGTYAGTGRVLGLDAPVPFRAEIDNPPIGLVIVLSAGMGALVWWRRRRHRRCE